MPKCPNVCISMVLNLLKFSQFWSKAWFVWLQMSRAGWLLPGSYFRWAREKLLCERDVWVESRSWGQGKKHHPLGSNYNWAIKPKYSRLDGCVCHFAFLSPSLFWGLLSTYVSLNPGVSVPMCFLCFSKQGCLTMFPTPTWANKFWEEKQKNLLLSSCKQRHFSGMHKIWPFPFSSRLLCRSSEVQSTVNACVPNSDWKMKRVFKKPPFWITKPIVFFKLNFYQQVLAFHIMLVIYWLFASHAGMKSAQSTLPWRKPRQRTSPQTDLQSLFSF